MTRQAVSIKGRQAGWDLGNGRDTTEERARSTLEAAVRKASHGKPSWGGEHTASKQRQLNTSVFTVLTI
jgi:hypothetical protein